MSLIDSLNQKIALYRIIRLRHRYLFTKTDRLRFRYIAGVCVVALLVVSSFLGAVGSSVAFAPSRLDMVAADTRESDDVFSPNIGQNEISGVIGPLVQLVEGQEDDVVDMSPYEEIIKISSGDTMAGALQSIGVSGADAYKAVKAMGKNYNPRSIKPGQVIVAHLTPIEDGGIELGALNMKISPIKELVIKRDERSRFSSDISEKEVVLQTKAAKAVIETSLYGSAAREGVPATIVAEMIKVYSYDVDFQRDIRKGDEVELLYETYETEDGDFARYGNIIYANLTVDGKKMPVYRYESKDGIVDYYRENGVSLKRILMQTPIDGARMSSGYGMRHHPVLGYNKMHKGVDFAASRGTPIYAAGNGVIDKAGRNGGYGNYIRIRHKNGLKTAYAHMKKFARGMRNGKRVVQGQVIGYVGTTGRSTGPHLHYEVLRNGKQVNPKSIKSSSGTKLTGASLRDFKAHVSVVNRQYAVVPTDSKFAQNSKPE